jgi:hypothetical protein
LLADFMLHWKQKTTYSQPSDWVFPSTRLNGKQPRVANMLVEDHLLPAAVKACILKTAAAFGLAALILPLALGKPSAGSGTGEAPNGADGNKPTAIQNSLTPPALGSIPVAFLISEGAVMIDFTGPWEVFQTRGCGADCENRIG